MRVGQSGTVGVSCIPASPKEHKIVWLSTNDPNEPKIRLEVGGYVEPPFKVFPNRLLFRRKLSGENVFAGKIFLRDPSGGKLTLEDVKTSCPEITCSRSHSDSIVTKSHAEVYRGQYALRTHTIAVTADLRDRKDAGEESLTIKTNSDWKPEIRVPIEIEVEPAVTAHPTRLFFGVVRKPATAICLGSRHY